MLQEPLTYNKNLHLDQRTKKLILGLLNSLLSVVPVDRKLEPDTTEQDAVPDPEKDLFIEEVLRNAFEHADVLKGIIDPGELERYYAYLKDYREISGKTEDLLDAINGYRDTAYQFSFRLAELLEEHMDMVSPVDKPCIRVNRKEFEEEPRLRVV
jgi:hypothetical protein